MNFITTNHQLALFFLSFLFSLFSQTAHNQINRISVPVRQLLRFEQPVPVSIHSLARDNDGILYLGANNSLLRFNGELKPLALLPGRVLVTCAQDGRVFAAGKNGFGFVEPDEKWNIRFVPVKSPLLQRAGEARQLISAGKFILIRFEQGTFMYSSTGLRKIDTGDSITSLVKAHDNRILAFGKKNIFRLNEAGFSILPLPGKFSAVTPELFVVLDSTTRFRFAGGVWLQYRNDSLAVPDGVLDPCWNTIKNVYRTGNHEYLAEDNAGSILLFDKHLILMGAAAIPGDAMGIEKFNLQPAGDGEVMLVGHSGLWEPVRIPGVQIYPLADYGIEAGVSDLARAGNELFAIAGGELFASRLHTLHGIPVPEAPFKRTGGNFGKVLALGLSPANAEICVASSNGLWMQRGQDFFPVLRDRNFREVVFIPGTKEILALEGDRLLRITPGNKPGDHSDPTAEVKIISGNMQDIQSACIAPKGEYFLRATDDRVIRLSAEGKQQEVSIPFYGTQPGWIRFANISGSTVLLSSSGAYMPAEGNTGYTSFPEWKKFTMAKGNWIYPLKEEPSSGNLLMAVRNTSERTTSILLVHADGTTRQYFLPGTDESEITAIWPDSSGFNWITSRNVLFCLDSRAEQRPVAEQRTILRALILEPDSILPDGLLGQGNTLRLASSQNAFTIKLANTGFEKAENTFYQVLLEGASRNATSWSTKNEYTFSGLRYGRYTLHVISRAGNSRETAPLIYHFVISRPFYLSWYAIVLYLMAIMGSAILYLRWRSWRFMQEKIHLEDLISKRTEELTKERDKSEQLIANILPKDTADELKKKGKASSQKYELVTVLFSDIQGFTHIAEQMNPETLIDQLDTFYYQFDSVAEKYNIEKIKTIGDAYMCAGGIPDKNRTNPVEVVLAGLEMQQFMKDLKATNANIWDLRIGVHTGPVIAGVVGHKKFSYDIWGDTVNVASRMESSGEAGKVNISGHTYDLVREFFICEYRGKMPVKYKGEVDMYFVKGIRPELSMNLKGLPNRHFFIQLQNLRLMDLEEAIVDYIGKAPDDKLHFHNLKYTVDVYTNAQL
ncbi:MAG: adenylate/guanylate cyclase domain-containing protein [Bacteroidales bacterium]